MAKSKKKSTESESVEEVIIEETPTLTYEEADKAVNDLATQQDYVKFIEKYKLKRPEGLLRLPELRQFLKDQFKK